MARKSKSVETVYCDFCGKSQHDVDKMIAGPRASICCECAEIAWDTVLEETTKEAKAIGSRMRYVVQVRFDTPFNATEKNLLPALMQSLQDTYSESVVSLKSFEERQEASVLYLYFDSPVKFSAAEIKTLQAEVENLSRLLKIEQEKYLAEAGERQRFEAMYHDLVETVFPILVGQMRKEGRLVQRSIKTMLIMFADIVGFSTSANDEKSQKLDLMRIVARSVLKSEQGLYLNTWGDGLIAAFDDPTQGLRCACKFVQHLNVDGIDVRVGVSWGAARIVFNDVTERMDIDGSSVNVAARLEPLASPGEVLASDIIVNLPDLRREDFIFNEREVELRKSVGDQKAGEKIKVFRVTYLPNR